MVAEKLKIPKAIEDFYYRKSSSEQDTLVPGLNPDHSYNSFKLVVILARAYARSLSEAKA